MTEQEHRLLEKHIVLFENDVSDEQRDALLEVVRKVAPEGYKHLMKSQCAYEFHMILRALLDPDDIS